MATKLSNQDRDEIRDTANDAARCKNCAQKLGYFQDDFIHYFTKETRTQQPIISRGYYVRVECYNMIINNFLSKYHNDCSIINLGAGFDTLYFRLKKANNLPKKIVELDMIQNVIKKRKIYEHYIELNEMLPEYDSHDHDKLVTDSYCLLPCDLTDLEQFKYVLKCSKVDLTKPILILSECVFIYIGSNYVNAILDYITSISSQISIVVFEQVHPEDAFGKTMVENLIDRGCPLLSINDYPNPEKQKQRYLNHGFHFCDCQDLYNLYFNFISKEEIQRITKLEFFDEFEEWFLMQTHYCITVACQDDILKDIYMVRNEKCPKVSLFAYM